MRFCLFCFLIFAVSASGQTLHHDMFSSQGGTLKLPNGVRVRQTLGQMSVTGQQAAQGKTVIQGFQQPFWSRRLAQSSKKVKIKVYPNPVTEKLFMAFEEAETGVVIKIYDLSGQLVLSEQRSTNAPTLEMDLSFLKAGLYLLQAETFQGKWYKKIIKK